jgi:glycosyltransferase involved in cell wall biosynthesis
MAKYEIIIANFGVHSDKSPVYRHNVRFASLLYRNFPRATITIVPVEELDKALTNCELFGRTPIVFYLEMHYDIEAELLAKAKSKHEFTLCFYQQGLFSRDRFGTVEELADAIITITPESARIFRDRWPDIPVYEMIYIINFEDFFIKTPESRISNKLLYTGRIIPLKLPIDFLKEAIHFGKPIDTYGPFMRDYWLDRPLEVTESNSEFVRLLKYNPKVFTNMGEVPHNNMNNVYNRYKVVLFPCPSEYFNIGIIESILAGCVPVVISNPNYSYMTSALPNAKNYAELLTMADKLLTNEHMRLSILNGLRRFVIQTYGSDYYDTTIQNIVFSIASAPRTPTT